MYIFCKVDSLIYLVYCLVIASGADRRRAQATRTVCCAYGEGRGSGCSPPGSHPAHRHGELVGRIASNS
eukprot:2957091-Pyramimonas_sp.AAC.1